MIDTPARFSPRSKAVSTKCSRAASLLRFALMGALAFAAFSFALADANLTVFIKPDEITGTNIPAAQWRLWPNGQWRNSSDTELQLPINMYTVEFSTVPSYYTPASTNVQIFSENLFITNTYLPWTNEFSVAIGIDEGTVYPSSPAWWLTASPPDFTNTSGTNNFAAVKCPTGTYTIVYGHVPGYQAPASSTINVIGDLPADFTGVYSRNTGDLYIEVEPPEGEWHFTSYPHDISLFTSDALSGTGFAHITNAPSGNYVLSCLSIPGYERPPPLETNLTFDTASVTLKREYGQGVKIRLHTYQPEELIDGTNYCAGIGVGTPRLTKSDDGEELWYDGDETWMVPPGTLVTFEAIPGSMVIGSDTYDCFFFEWGGSGASINNPMEMVVSHDQDMTLLFSREFYPFDNVGDLDQDGLPDEWERRWGLDPKSDQGDDGMYGNPSEDFIPSISRVPPTVLRTGSEMGSEYYGASFTVPGYPLRGLALERGYNNSDPDTAPAFNNFLQCRGLDGYYKTNGESGYVPDDDPRTNPKVKDTSGRGWSDGWAYYFWYWRSASSYADGITNSANLDWVKITPSLARMAGGTGGDNDSDRDGLTDLEEYRLGTDPTHADTDGDGMDDYWEAKIYPETMNPLSANDRTLNEDNDYFARSTVDRVLTNETPGTPFLDPVYSHPTDPDVFWVDVSIASGAGVFDIYKDILLTESAMVVVTNLTEGQPVSFPVLYGTSDDLDDYQRGYPVWLDVDGDGTFSDGDIAIINPFIKHSAVYMSIPAEPGPGVTSFDPYLGWNSPGASAMNRPYTAFEEYLGGDHLGRVAWDAAGRAFVENDDTYAPSLESYTDPGNVDTDGDGIPDGWELYVGLNPHNAVDATGDPDGDGVSNLREWANATDPLNNCADTWPTKTLPTDPGVLTPPLPNDPHPADTDWDGVSDSEEMMAGTCPTCWDTDGDGMPDGWELYAGTDPLLSDALEDYDGDGLLNIQEYWTGIVSEWMMCDPDWRLNFMSRRSMAWDSAGDYFLPPDFLTCGSFMFENELWGGDIEVILKKYPAAASAGYQSYHTTLANDVDSDGDGMDDYWEVYHALNPLQGRFCLMLPAEERYTTVLPKIASPDARPDLPGFQFGIQGTRFQDKQDLFDFMEANPDGLPDLVGPFNFGLPMMDPDGDGLPNIDEYSYKTNSALYHTDPTPIWRTCEFSSNSFVNLNYRIDPADLESSYIFPFEMGEGFDTDGDGVGDYHEINKTSGLAGGIDPLDARDPLRNRALYLNGKKDFARTLCPWEIVSETEFTKFCVEAWINPSSDTIAAKQAVIAEKASFYPNPYDLNNEMLAANFQLGIADGVPYIMYNGRGAGRKYQSAAKVAHKLISGQWTHIAGSYDGTNLVIYVNGEASTTVRTMELPATGYSVGETNTEQTLIIGGSDLNPGQIGTKTIAVTNLFGGYIDELRIWNGRRTRSQILQLKDRRIMREELEDAAYTNLYAYYSFDDVPDPAKEGTVPAGMDELDSNLRFHPTLPWWAKHSQRSTVYKGSKEAPYNYIVFAQDHIAHKPMIPPLDDRVNMIVENPGQTNEIITLPEGYKNTTNPYHEQYAGKIGNFIKDLLLYRGAKGVAAPSWLPSSDPNDPDSADTDGDGLPDWWESLYGLDPYDPTGINGAFGDPDNDGLNNMAEYLAGTDPWSSDTDGDGTSDYDSNAGPGTRTWGEIYSDGDGMPDEWEYEHGLDPNKYDAHLDSDGDGWSNYAEYQAGTDPSDPDDHPDPTVSGNIIYSGRHSLADSPILLLAYQTPNMDGVPVVATASVTNSGTATYQIADLKEGDVYIFAFLDLNNDQRWNQGEPCGLAWRQPLYLSWSDINDYTVGLADDLPGYGRFTWAETENQNGLYEVLINRITEPGAPTYLYRALKSPRNWMHEWDYQINNFYGFPAGTYQWWVDAQNGTFSVNWPVQLAKPTLIYPKGAIFNLAKNLIGWAMDSDTTAYCLQIFNSSLEVVVNDCFTAPYRDKDNVYWDYLPNDANDFGNDVFFWRIAGLNPASQSEWSDLQSFQVRLLPSTSRSISGSIYYHGKAGATKVVVQAFDNPAFSGRPEASKAYFLDCTEDSFKTSFTLRGLLNKTYYVRAFIDTAPAGGAASGQVEFWSSVGFVPMDADSYKPKALNLADVSQIGNTKITIRDKDTDNDKLPDAWEMQYFGNMDQTGDMDFDGDGDSNLTEYCIERLDTDPTKWDTDGDGLTDRFERLYGGSEDYDPYCPITNPDGRDLNPTKWDTDGDGYSDGAELRRYGTDPLSVNSFPYYDPGCYGSRPAPADFDGDGRSDLAIYDEASGKWYIATWEGEYQELQFGNWATQPLTGDFDGDGKADFALYEPATGYWYIYTAAGEFMMLPFGGPTMIPVPGDYDGDWRTDFAVYDTATGIWYVYTWNGQFTVFQFGNSSTIPVPGDYDADNRSDFAVYEPISGIWYLFTWDMNFYMLQFGNEACIPVPGDYDGDDRNDFALFDSSSGSWYILTWTGEFHYGQFGWPGATPMAGDYSGDGRSDLAVYSPITGDWYIYCWSGGKLFNAQFGWAGATPVLKTK